MNFVNWLLYLKQDMIYINLKNKKNPMFLKKKGLMVSCASLFSFAKLILLTFHEWELRKIKGFHDIESWIWPSFYNFVISRRLSSNLIRTLIFFPLSSFHRGKFTPTKFASLAFPMEIDYSSYMYISNSSLEYTDIYTIRSTISLSA